MITSKDILKLLLYSILGLFFLDGCAHVITVQNGYDYASMDRLTKKVHNKAERFITKAQSGDFSYMLHEGTKIVSVEVDKTSKTIVIDFSPEFAFMPMRLYTEKSIYLSMRSALGWRFRNYTLTLRSLHRPIHELIPNYYRGEFQDKTRIPLKMPTTAAHVTKTSIPFEITAGLSDNHLAVWHSHGWYYNNETDRWEWMRPRLFQTVEDLLPMSFTIPYLFPMLENSGANLYIPKERDPQTNEVICDNDSPDSTTVETGDWQTAETPGFAIGLPPYGIGDNPFRQGSFRFTTTDSVATASVTWIPEITKTGEYAVYISYGKLASAVSDAKYTVHHAGGATTFLVNQQLGYETWVYLGTFKFIKDKTCSVVLSNQSKSSGRSISADAVRFGGGMGNIIRGGKTGKRPRFLESARYYLQYAGMPDSLYNVHADTNDYKDDYQRGEWVNYLKGNPYGPNTNREIDGLKIPIDLALAFHTDAGIKENSSIGTLAIYRLEDELESEYFPDSTSRMANRDLADLVQTQIVDDIWEKYDPNWNRRKLWNADYRSARTPNVPTLLLELLSHQNFYDMQFALDPQFRFDVSRSIYKGILKYLTNQENRDYVVHPLPVNHFAAEFVDAIKVRLSWKPVFDPLEPTAVPEKYIAYTRIADGGFDNGTVVDTSGSIILTIKPGIIYSYKVTAVNTGGESFPSEILSVCRDVKNPKTVLIVNGFDRVSGPAIVDEYGHRGFANIIDEGVSYKYDLNFTGAQFDFTPESQWTTNDLPGYGASHADLETKIIPGNTFDFPYIHGVSIKNAGYSFVSVSDEVAEDSLFNLSKYSMVDFILGEEKSTTTLMGDSLNYTVFSDAMITQITDYCGNGGNLFVSGAHIGTDLFSGKSESHPDIRFARDVLIFNWATDHASQSGTVFSTDVIPELEQISFNQNFHPSVYKVESPDALDPIPGMSSSLLRYGDNHFSAGTYYNGNYRAVVLGFPFETIIDQVKRDTLMKAVLEAFSQ